jgi:hypothetical protein
MQTPFEFNFFTDGYTMSTAKSVFKGFKLVYYQTTC